MIMNLSIYLLIYLFIYFIYSLFNRLRDDGVCIWIYCGRMFGGASTRITTTLLKVVERR